MVGENLNRACLKQDENWKHKLIGMLHGISYISTGANNRTTFNIEGMGKTAVDCLLAPAFGGDMFDSCLYFFHVDSN